MGCSAESIVDVALLQLVDKLVKESGLIHIPRMYVDGKISREKVVQMMQDALNDDWVKACLVYGKWDKDALKKGW